MPDAQLIQIDGSVKEVTPKNGKHFSLKELQGFVGGTISLVALPRVSNRHVMVVNDNGRLVDLMINRKASDLFQEAWPVKEYPLNNDGIVVGDVLVCLKRYLN